MATLAGKIKIVIVEDHLMLAESLKEMINRQDDMEVIGISDSANEAVHIIESTMPEVAIIDINLKGNVNGIDLIISLKKRQPNIKTLVLSMYDESLYAERAIKAGARGYLMKKEVMDTLFEAIRYVKNGNIYLSKKITSNLLEDLIVRSDSVTTDIVGCLSNREFEIFQLIGKGYKNSEIARELNLNVKTVDTHRLKIKRKMNFNDSRELTKYAVHWVNKQNDI